MLIFAGIKYAESRSLYQKTNVKVEKLCKIVVITFMIGVQSLEFSKFLLSYYLYYTTDLNSDAFEMPFPYWWALPNVNVLKLRDDKHKFLTS